MDLTIHVPWHRLGAYALIALASVVSASPAHAQERQTQTRDSLQAQVANLLARIDSLERTVARIAGAGAARTDTAGAGEDELVALLTAAKAAAGPPDTTDQANRQFVDRSRSQSGLNPEISATADVRIQVQGEGPQSHNVDVREFELALQSPLDPFSSTKIFASFSEEGVGIEEGYAYWTGLPGHIRLDLGRFREQFGELNRWHPHELPWSEYPLAIREYLGEEGLAGDGLGLYWLVPAGGGAWGAHELTVQTTLADNPTLFEGGHRLAFLGHLNNFWNLSPAAFVQLGVSALYGENPDSALRTTTFGVDFRVSWRPPRQGSYRSFTLRAEGFATRHEIRACPAPSSAPCADPRWAGPTRYGGYAAAEYQLGRRLFAGLRYDYVQPLRDGDAIRTVVPNLTWWQSEWVYVRAEFQHGSIALDPALPGVTNRFLIQAVWAIGPHKHETY